MKVNKTGSAYEFILEGALGETSPLFSYDVRDASSIVIDMLKTTYINSAGVKAWIQWTVRIPEKSQFTLRNLPLVMINQVNVVQGFATPQTVIESFQAPFVCPDCNIESTMSLVRGREYDYAVAGGVRRVALPKPVCQKCKTPLEADFTEARLFAFLDKPL